VKLLYYIAGRAVKEKTAAEIMTRAPKNLSELVFAIKKITDDKKRCG
jgi:plasmid maintenance system antidote protein VapI